MNWLCLFGHEYTIVAVDTELVRHHWQGETPISVVFYKCEICQNVKTKELEGTVTMEQLEGKCQG